jgi:small subunit ribosomal protein S6
LASYELMFILKPELDDDQVATATDRVHQLVVANGGDVTKTAAWGKRRLAYKVGQYGEGHYVVSNFEVGPDKIIELERVLKISDTVFRHLLVRREAPAVGQSEVVVPEASAEDIAAIYQPASDEGVATYNEEDVEGIDADAELESKKVESGGGVAVAETAAETAENPAAEVQTGGPEKEAGHESE